MTENPQGDIVQDILVEKLKQQPWYKTYINTTIVAVTLAVNVIWLLISVGADVDPTIIGALTGLIQALGVVGVKFAPNGVTPRQIKEIEEYAGRHRK